MENDLVNDWLDELVKEYPIFNDVFERTRIGNIMSEYFHVYFDPDNNEVKLVKLWVECGDTTTYASEKFKEKARIIAEKFYRRHFDRLLLIILKLVDIARQRNIVPEFIVRDIKPRNINGFRDFLRLNTIYGIPVKTHRENKVRMESSEFGFLVELDY